MHNEIKQTYGALQMLLLFKKNSFMCW